MFGFLDSEVDDVRLEVLVDDDVVDLDVFVDQLVVFVHWVRLAYCV